MAAIGCLYNEVEASCLPDNLTWMSFEGLVIVGLRIDLVADDRLGAEHCVRRHDLTASQTMIRKVASQGHSSDGSSRKLVPPASSTQEDPR